MAHIQCQNFLNKLINLPNIINQFFLLIKQVCDLWLDKTQFSKIIYIIIICLQSKISLYDLIQSNFIISNIFGFCNLNKIVFFKFKTRFVFII